jgi:hypothetical protein
MISSWRQRYSRQPAASEVLRVSVRKERFGLLKIRHGEKHFKGKQHDFFSVISVPCFLHEIENKIEIRQIRRNNDMQISRKTKKLPRKSHIKKRRGKLSSSEEYTYDDPAVAIVQLLL